MLVLANFAVKSLLARSIGDIELEALVESVAFSKSQRTGVFLVITSSEKCKAGAQGRSHVPH